EGDPSTITPRSAGAGAGRSGNSVPASRLAITRHFKAGGPLPSCRTGVQSRRGATPAPASRGPTGRAGRRPPAPSAPWSRGGGSGGLGTARGHLGPHHGGLDLGGGRDVQRACLPHVP